MYYITSLTDGTEFKGLAWDVQQHWLFLLSHRTMLSRAVLLPNA